jgi:hypothetical protein
MAPNHCARCAALLPALRPAQFPQPSGSDDEVLLPIPRHVYTGEHRARRHRRNKASEDGGAPVAAGKKGEEKEAKQAAAEEPDGANAAPRPLYVPKDRPAQLRAAANGTEGMAPAGLTIRRSVGAGGGLERVPSPLIPKDAQKKVEDFAREMSEKIETLFPGCRF